MKSPRSRSRSSPVLAGESLRRRSPVCEDCRVSLIYTVLLGGVYFVARHAVDKGNHFHFFVNRRLKNTDHVPTPPEGVPIP
jgi:hypothetical protein